MKPVFCPMSAGVTVLLTLCSLGIGQSASAQITAPAQPERIVQDNVLTSSALPKTSIQVDRAFSYVGKFDFTIRDIAYGERHVFVDAQDKKVNRLFIFQFEGFLPNNEHTYRYTFTDAEVIAGFRFRQNTWAYSNAMSAKENPAGEGPLTAAFLRAKGYELEDELMMSRFLMVPDKAKRNELILFYLENASPTGHTITSFYDEKDEPTPHWRELSVGLTERSRKAFEILEE